MAKYVIEESVQVFISNHGSDGSTRHNPIDVNIILQAEYIAEWVVWKGSKDILIKMSDGRELPGRMSTYGNFFAVDGIAGYFTYNQAINGFN